MAEAIKTTKTVEHVTLTMTIEEAKAVHNLLWLTESPANRGVAFNALKDVQGALSAAIQVPEVDRIRFDMGNQCNSPVAIFLTEN